jgi:hypothetical protein
MAMFCRVLIGYFDATAACHSYREPTPTRPVSRETVDQLQTICRRLFADELPLADYRTASGILGITEGVVRPATHRAACVAHELFGMSAVDHAHRTVLFPTKENPPVDREQLLTLYRAVNLPLSEQQLEERAEQDLRWFREDWALKQEIRERVRSFKVVDPAWLQWGRGTIPVLAQGICEERAFDRLPVLADALEEAGCADAETLAHCRAGTEHEQGCWVVDALLGHEWLRCARR